MRKQNYYLELKRGEKVIKRKKTTLAKEYEDRRMLEQFKESDQEIFFIVTPQKEKVIN